MPRTSLHPPLADQSLNQSVDRSLPLSLSLSPFSLFSLSLRFDSSTRTFPDTDRSVDKCVSFFPPPRDSPSVSTRALPARPLFAVSSRLLDLSLCFRPSLAPSRLAVPENARPLLVPLLANQAVAPPVPTHQPNHGLPGPDSGSPPVLRYGFPCPVLAFLFVLNRVSGPPFRLVHRQISSSCRSCSDWPFR